MISKPRIITADELFREAPDLGRCELLRGKLMMMSPSGFEHGRIVVRITVALATFIESRGLGVVTGAETGYVLARDPDTVRAPDVAMVRSERVPAARVQGFFEGPPDLAVEVVSSNDRPSQVADKVRQWIAAGCTAVWVVDPDAATITVHRGNRDPVIFHMDGTVREPELMPGFSLPVTEVFRTG